MHTDPELLALLALGENVGTLGDHEHISGCPECSREISEFSQLAQVGRSVGSDLSVSLTRPGPHVWDRVRSELGFADVVDAANPAQASPSSEGAHPWQPAQVRQPAQRDEESRGGIVTALPSPPVRAGRTLGWLALAAALALIAGIGIGVGSQRLGEPDQTVLANAQLEAFPKYPGSKGEAAVETDSDGNRVLVVTMETSERVEDLQVWMIEASGKGLRPMGFIQQGSGRFTLPDTMDLKRFPIVDVSDEPLNDGNPAHSGNTVVRGALKI